MPSKIRNAFIRVSSTNDTADGLKTYTIDDIQFIIDNWLNSANFLYYFAEHPADEDVNQTHWHILLRFPSPAHFDTIKNRFPFGDIKPARNSKNCIQYLVHLNDSSKVQFSWDIVRTNDPNTDWYKVQSNSSQEMILQSIISKIVAGEIPQHLQAQMIPPEIWTKYSVRITKAFEYRIKLVTADPNRKINVVYFSGSTGTGKSTFAKLYCNRMGLSYCESSSSNDLLQGYEGQDVLILDDFRGDVQKGDKSRSVEFHDFLKLVDLNTRSSFKSRYHNKEFVGSLIIITSTRPVHDLYFDLSVEDKHQLFRRISYQYQFTKEKIYVYRYCDDPSLYHGRYFLEETLPYIPESTMLNPINGMFTKSCSTPLDISSAFGVNVTPFEATKIDDSSNIEKPTVSEFLKYRDLKDEEIKRQSWLNSLPPVNEENIKKYRVG